MNEHIYNIIKSAERIFSDYNLDEVSRYLAKELQEILDNMQNELDTYIREFHDDESELY